MTQIRFKEYFSATGGGTSSSARLSTKVPAGLRVRILDAANRNHISEKNPADAVKAR
jgi:hypothetical protein